LRPFNVMAFEIQILLEFPVPFLEKEGERWGGYTS